MARTSATNKASLILVPASVCIVVAALYFAQSVFIPVALAVLVTFLLAPPVEWLQRIHIKRPAATLLVVAITIGVVGLLAYVVGKQLVSLVNDLPHYKVDIQAKLHRFQIFEAAGERVAGRMEELGRVADKHPVAIDGPAPAGAVGNAKAPLGSPENPTSVRVSSEPGTQIEMVGEWIGKFVDPLVTLGLVAVFVIFMLLNREDLRDRVVRLVGYSRIELTTQALDEAGTRISRYLLAQGYVNVAYGVATTLGLWLIGHTLARQAGGFPNVVLWGLLCGLLRFVPYIGIWIAAALPVLVSFALPGFSAFLATTGMFVGYEVIVSQFVEPYFYGASTGLTPLAVLVAAVFWTWLWGPIGLLLSTPLTVCLVVISKYVPQFAFLGVLLSDEPMLDPYLRLYQRLLALDEEEASELARTQLTELGLEGVYDQVLMPVLARAERDRNQDRLDAERLRFVLDTLRTIVDELGDLATKKREPAASAEEPMHLETRGAAVAERSVMAKLPEGCAVNVLLLPARGEADELAALMLGQILQSYGYCPAVMSNDLLSAELVQKVDQHKADIVVVSAMPPAATANARYLCKRLRARAHMVPLVVGLWNRGADLAAARTRLDVDDSAALVSNLVEASQKIAQLAAPLISQATVASPAALVESHN